MFVNNRGVCIKRVEFRGKVTDFFPQGQSKQSAITRCAIKRTRKTGFDWTNIREQFLHAWTTWTNSSEEKPDPTRLWCCLFLFLVCVYIFISLRGDEWSINILTARKILPLLDLLTKFNECSRSPNFCVARKLAKQIFYFCSSSQKNRSVRHARECSQRPFVTPSLQMFQWGYVSALLCL